MWSNLPYDLLSTILSYLPPDSLARARTTCRTWRSAADSSSRRCHPPWFLALPARNWAGHSCYAHNPITGNWHALKFPFRDYPPIKPIAAVGGLILARISNQAALHLALINPFTRQFRALPMLIHARANPAVGVVEENSGFKIYVAGGMSVSSSSSAAAAAAAAYNATVEMYQSRDDTWRVAASTMPVELAVRLTVWTPNESVYSGGTLYWMTSARAYSVMGFEVGTHKWKEVGVPMADRLEFAAMVGWEGNGVGLVGGTCDPGSCKIWELGEEGCWRVLGRVPSDQLGGRVLEGGLGGVKCVGIDGAMCLYRDDVVGCGVLVGRVACGKWEWGWIEGFGKLGGVEKNFHCKGFLVYPDLAHHASLSIIGFEI